MSTITGVVKKILPIEQGETKSGSSWQKQSFVITTVDKYPKDVCFTTFGDKLSLIGELNVGASVDVSYNLSSREYNGKYYHNIDAWRVESSAASSKDDGFTSTKTEDEMPF
jgi:hypothetical protein